jgi:subtilisin family serine protease
MRYVLIVIAVLTAATSAAAQGPAFLPNSDPLSQAVPALDDDVRFLAGPRTAVEKMVPILHRKLAEVKGVGVLDVVVTLYDPIIPPEFAPGTGEFKSVRADRIAVLEHRFVAQSAATGFVARRGMKHIPVVAGTIPADAVERLAMLPIVSWIEHDFDLEARRSQGGALIDAPELRSLGGSGNGIGVAVLDTGIDWTHPELSGSKVTAAGDYTGTQSVDQGFDDEGHGTACAGIVAGSSGGMAPQAHLWALKVLDAEGSGSFSYTVAALDDVYANLGSYGGVHVVNLSIGGSNVYNYACDSQMPSMTSAMSRLVNSGVTIFVSSGNDGCSDGINFPACVSHAISVGAVYDANVGGIGWSEGACTPQGCNDTTTAADKIACYSNSGSPLDILAPSYACSTTAMGGGYWGPSTGGYFSGTSASCPYAAGVAAQIKSLRPSSTPAEIRTAMKSTGNPILDSRNGVSRRRIEADAAYAYLMGGGGGGGGGSCTSITSRILLQNGRFAITGVAFLQGNPTDFFLQNLCPYGAPSQTSAAFYFNQALPPVEEGFVSIRNECGGSRNAYVVEVACASTRKFLVDVTDTWTGTTKRYENPTGGSSTCFTVDAVSFRNSCP